MQWSPQQEAALSKVGEWLKSGSDGQQVFRLFGYAGTGKTTLAVHLAQDAGRVLFAAFTGKAAHVMRTKGCVGASTLHSLIYQPREKGTFFIDDLNRQLDELIAELKAEMKAEGQSDEDIANAIARNDNVVRLREKISDEQKTKHKPMFQLKAESDLRHADLLVVDECSMVGQDMGEDLLSFGTKILVLGDPAQLPPVRGNGYFTEARPDVLLTEIHRQARDNPIIDMATRIREGKELEYGQFGESAVVPWGSVTPEMATKAGQILVGTNKLRHGTNRRMRTLLGRDGTPFPVKGDRLVCLRNDRELGLLNGSIWTVKDSTGDMAGRVGLELEPTDYGSPLGVSAHSCLFTGSEPSYYEAREAAWFDYGYALTVHKSQGSQWDDVLIFDESHSFRDDARRWLYTALTRAASKVTVARK